MKIEYTVSITDSYGAYYLVQRFDNVEEAIALHEALDTPEELGHWVMNNFVNIDHYYIDNPYKRFEVLIMVEYC